MRLTSASILVVSAALAVVPGVREESSRARAPSCVTEDDKTLYALGQIISKNLDAFQLSPQELEIVKTGIEDGVAGKPAAVDLEKYGEKIQELHQTRSAALAEKEKATGRRISPRRPPRRAPRRPRAGS